MNKEEILNIVYITDEKYSAITATSIQSLKHNRNKNKPWKVYVLCNSLTEDSVRKLSDMAEENFAIEIVKVSPIGSESRYEIDTISAKPTSMYKFRIPEILNGIDKCLYLDGDMIIKKDLSHLFSMDIEEYYAAVTPEYIDDEIPFACKRIGCSHKVYFCSGIMLMNLKKMRADGITAKLIDYRENGKNFFMDQDALNFIIGGEVCLISRLYNVFTYDACDGKRIYQYNTENKKYKSRKSLIKDAYVLHYASRAKPWVYKVPRITKIFMYYYNLCPFRDSGIKPVGYFRQWKDKIYDRIYGKKGEGFVYKTLHKISSVVRKK